MEDLFNTIFASVFAILFLVFWLVLCVFAIIYSVKCSQNQKKFIASLSDEEKALILEYKENGKLPLSVIFKKDE